MKYQEVIEIREAVEKQFNAGEMDLRTYLKMLRMTWKRFSTPQKKRYRKEFGLQD